MFSTFITTHILFAFRIHVHVLVHVHGLDLGLFYVVVCSRSLFVSYISTYRYSQYNYSTPHVLVHFHHIITTPFSLPLTTTRIPFSPYHVRLRGSITEALSDHPPPLERTAEALT